MDQKLTMVRGDTGALGMDIKDQTGAGQILDSAYFTVRDAWEGQILFQKSLDDGITMQEDGQYVVRIAPDDTKSVHSGEYYYDLEISANGDVFTVLRGILMILHDVTY